MTLTVAADGGPIPRALAATLRCDRCTATLEREGAANALLAKARLDGWREIRPHGQSGPTHMCPACVETTRRLIGPDATPPDVLPGQLELL